MENIINNLGEVIEVSEDYLIDVADTEIIFLTDCRPTKAELESFFIEKIKLLKI